MNPLSPLTYYSRHKRSTLLLIAIIVLATVGIFLMVSILDSIPLRIQSNYLTQVSRVYPKVANQLEPGIISQIETHPDVDYVISSNNLSINYPVLIGVENLTLLGTAPSDVEYLIGYVGLRLKEGRLFHPRTNEIVLDDAVSRALNLQIGDQIAREMDDRYYFRVVAPLTVVGILERDPSFSGSKDPTPQFGFISGEYLAGHELYAPVRHEIVVIPNAGQLESVNNFLETQISSDYTGIDSLYGQMRFVSMARKGLYVIFGLVNCLVAIIVAMVVAAINRIALMERIEELGVLNALGFNKQTLTRRMISETSVVTIVGWLIGLLLSLSFLVLLRDTVLYDLGSDLNIWNLSPFIFVIPIPLAVIGSAIFSIRRVLNQLDSVDILGRGKLSTEEEKKHSTTKQSTAKPLSSLTFYKRHRRRGIMLITTMAMMILGVAMPAFLLLTSINAMKPDAESLRHFSEVFPVQGQMVDANIAAEIRSHPNVEKIISTLTMGIQMNMPPGGSTTIALYGLSEDDIPFFTNRLGLYLIDGRLPYPRSNELVISESVAKNRGLVIGDTIGSQSERETNTTFDDNIPVDMVITGILGPDIPWLGFASMEFLQNHELTQNRTQRLLVFPAIGYEKNVNTWLEKNIVNTLTDVNTYEASIQDFEEITMMMAILFMVVESIIALVAAVALATLNYIFFNQRREEFGILHAIGRSRLWLTFRTVKETGSTVFIAWLIGAAICMLGLVLAQILIYNPLGLTAGMGNLLPWMFTLPIPIIVVIVNVGTISRILRKLDPVAIVERR